MTGILQLLLGGSSAAPAYQIQRSLRFNSADSAYLNRTPASAGNQKTWTWSAWVKRSKLGSSYFEGLFAVSGTPRQYLAFYQDKFYMYGTGSTGDFVELSSNAVYRDTSAWYHLVVAYDTTQATGSNRVKVYINGVEQTLTFTTTPTQNSDGAINRAGDHFLGAETGSANRFNGYMTEVNFIDGQALTPSSFGETNANTGVWQPKAYSGTYGTNGFYLNFSDNSGTTSTTLGKDYSGNGNNWTPNNFSVTAGAGNDSLVDTPTPYGSDTGAGDEVRGNYATLNPLKINTAANNQFSNGNLDYTVGAYDVSVVSTIGVSTGKWYWEVQWTQDGGFDRPGIVPEDASASESPTNNGIVWNRLSTTNGMVMLGNNVSGSWGSAFSVNDIIMFALDCDNKALYIGQNGTWRNSGSPTSGSSKTGAVDYSSTSLNDKTLFPLFGKGNAGTTSYIANFGQRPFAYTAPSGFKALCTQNLPTPTIGATSTTQAGKYFNTVLYTGNGSTQTVSGVGFQPDLVWNKQRSSSVGSNWLNDAVRTAGYSLSSNRTDAEADFRSYFTAFNSDGFGLAGGTDGFNANAATYVAWNWKANGAGSSNTAGSVTSTVSVNTDADFSIVTFTSPSGTGNFSAGHGLGVTPEFVIVKSRDAAGNWYVYHKSLATNNYLELNSTNAAQSATDQWGAGMTSSVIGLRASYSTVPSATTVAYCFAPVAGYSAFGSYTGNGSTDGPFVYTGFRPKWIMYKDASATNAWVIVDTVRQTYNVLGPYLLPNASDAEGTTTILDSLSNGFKIRVGASSANNSGNTIIYAAFAEFPFKYTLAR